MPKIRKKQFLLWGIYNLYPLNISHSAPIIGMTFLLTLMPSIIIAQSVQKTLSIQTGDYMPFQINYLFIFVIFILLNMLYSLVKITFISGIKSIINKENITYYTNTN
jgi:putative ABC transport system permease protein